MTRTHCCRMTMCSYPRLYNHFKAAAIMFRGVVWCVLLTCRNGAVSGVVIEPVDVFPTLGAEV